MWTARVAYIDDNDQLGEIDRCSGAAKRLLARKCNHSTKRRRGMSWSIIWSKVLESAGKLPHLASLGGAL